MEKLVIFDCDGVLVDSEIIASRIEAEGLTACGYPITTQECIRRFTGLNAKSSLKIIFDEAKIELPSDFATSIQNRILAAFENELLPLMEKVLHLLEEKNVTRCVASSSPKSRVLYSLERTQQRRFFSLGSIFSAEEVLHGKPAPDLFLFTADQMGFLPENCIVIEDSLAGIQAALSANMQTVGFLGASHAKYEWYQQRFSGYDIPFAYDVNELLEVLQNFLEVRV